MNVKSVRHKEKKNENTSSKTFHVHKSLKSLTLKDSDHDALQSPGRSGSGVTASSPLRDRMSTQSIIRIIRGGGFPSRRTVAMSADLIVCKLTCKRINGSEFQHGTMH